MLRRPLDILNVAVLFLLLGIAVAAGLAGNLPSWAGWAARFAGLLLLVLAVAWGVGRARRLPYALQLFVNFYPLLIVPAVYDSLGALVPALNRYQGPLTVVADDGVRVPALRDPWLIAADRAIFRTDPTIWLQRFITPWLVNLMYLGYCTYFFFPLVVGVTLWVRDRAVARRFIFVAVAAFYVSYVGYFLVPAYGPRVTLVHAMPVKMTPLARAIAGTLNNLENTRQDAFPSGHTMITAVCLIFAARYTPRLFVGLLPVGIVLVCSTVFCRYHYVVDVLAGLALAFLTVPAGNWIFDRYETQTIAALDRTGRS